MILAQYPRKQPTVRQSRPSLREMQYSWLKKETRNSLSFADRKDMKKFNEDTVDRLQQMLDEFLSFVFKHSLQNRAH